MNKFFFVANAALGHGLSGSDRIFIELAKQWSVTGNEVRIGVWEEGAAMCTREGLSRALLEKWYLGRLKTTSFILNYALRIFSGIYYALTTKINSNESSTFIYSCSDFWQDAIPALILKLKNPKAKLIGSYYLAAPNPFIGFKEEGKIKFPSLKSLLYFFQQQPIYWLFRHYADFIFITSDPDKLKFPRQNSQGKCVVVKGGVNLEKVEKWSIKFVNEPKIYDAVFLGRFHPQKGVLELIKIWKLVVQQKPNAVLVMLGDGPLMESVKSEVINNNLKQNVILKGFVFDGEEKYKIFAQSKIVVHPAVYDSGGMAAAEAMAWRLPAVSFDLEALKSYYPRGMIKVPLDNFPKFAEEIISLLTNNEKYDKISQSAYSFIHDEWGWDSRATNILKTLTSEGQNVANVI